MAIVKMSKLAVCAMKEQRKEILETLQNLSVMEIIDIEEDDGTVHMDTHQSQLSFEKNSQQAIAAVEILNKYIPEKIGLFESLNGKTLKAKSEARRIEGSRDEIVEIVHRILDYQQDIVECNAEIVKNRTRIEQLSPWKNLDVSLNFRGTALTRVIIGTIPYEIDEAKIREVIAEKYPDIEAYDVEIIALENSTTYLSLISFEKDCQSIEMALREIGFAKPSISGHQAPPVQIDQCNIAIERLKQKIDNDRKAIIGLSGYREDIKMTADYFGSRGQKYEVLARIPQTANTFFIEGYVPKMWSGKVKEILETKFDAMVEEEELTEEEDVPVLLKNNKFSEMVEGTTASFGLPGKGEEDPTFIMSLFFVFFFGLMLSDAAYGFILSLVCGILLWKCPRMEKGMKSLIQIFFWGGISTVFWGVMFGGYFGDAVNIVTKTFFGKEVTVPALWFIPLNDPMKLLIWSMIFGLVHLFTGLGFKGYLLLKKKDFTAFIFDVLCWYMLLIGLILMLVPSKLFAGIAGQQIIFPPYMGTVSKILAIAGALGIVLMSARDNKNFGLRVALGLYDLYGVSGWLSDVLSYSRLLALGLATGVIASVINQMGTMFGGGVIGAVLFVIIFIGGHLLNIAINLLGAYVHTCRLQYVEFFGKFYDGGGRAFAPFDLKTKYVDFKEED